MGRRLVEENIHRVPVVGSKTVTAGFFDHNEPSIGLFEVFDFERWRIPRTWRSSMGSNMTW
ncbi:MAG: hypothetical protein AVDCRST_MAG28-2603 [uncultured Rubrobacteraceae bacterium]|uniref:Uncharacterized protein n=1 Tax=uncultured Rubrobacteraceae bacterium TaxID=349277 RepID=A0A6J4QWG5_9ACTN|nr:MAG: hypothetical protein AVDCRST_MAG28-2603 [uncultured Rubrobacteraceae bacterium]